MYDNRYNSFNCGFEVEFFFINIFISFAPWSIPKERMPIAEMMF